MPEEKENKKQESNGINNFFKQLTPKQWLIIAAILLVYQQGGGMITPIIRQAIGLPVIASENNEYLTSKQYFKDSLLNEQWKAKVNTDLDTVKNRTQRIENKLNQVRISRKRPVETEKNDSDIGENNK